VLVTKFIPKVEELKDLDCYKIDFNKDGRYSFIISKGIKRCSELDYYLMCDEVIDLNDWHIDLYQYTKITREEMQAELAKHGKYFDFEEKVLKNLRWRATKGQSYWHLSSHLESVWTAESNTLSDQFRFDNGNYHQTKEQCDEYAKKMIAYSKSLIK
jgi:hypothetical protein